MDPIKFIQIEPTTRCNFNCSFCYGRTLESKEMDFKVFKAIIDTYQNLEHLELQGEGEPLLHPNFFEMVKYAKERKICVSTITNGSLFSQINTDKILESGIDAINISIESPSPEVFKSIRGGNLKTIIKGIEDLITKRNKCELPYPKIGFSVTVLKDTIAQQKEIYALYDQLKMDGNISMQFLNVTKEYAKVYDSEMSKQHITQKEQHIIVRDYYRWQAKANVNTEAIHFFQHLEEKIRHNKGKENYCAWLENALYINVDGLITSCVYMKDAEKYYIGHALSTDAQKVNQTREESLQKFKAHCIPKACQEVQCAIVKKILSSKG